MEDGLAVPPAMTLGPTGESVTTLVVFVGGAGGLFLLSGGVGDVWGGPYRGKDTRAGCLKAGILPCVPCHPCWWPPSLALSSCSSC